MKYLKLFNNHSQYTAFTQTEDFILPNVSHCIAEGDVHYNPIPDPYNGIQYVDMGFPSGAKWATMNIGASNPLLVGDYYTWGETVGYNNKQDLPTYDKNMTYDEYNLTDHKYILESDDDAASVNMGGEWRMPSAEECTELVMCSLAEPVYATDNNTKSEPDPIGIKYTSIYNGNYIIIPAADLWVAESADNRGIGNTKELTKGDTKFVENAIPLSHFWTNKRVLAPGEQAQSKAISSPTSIAYGNNLLFNNRFPVAYYSSYSSESKSETPITDFIRHLVYMPVRGVVNQNENYSIAIPLMINIMNSGSMIGEAADINIDYVDNNENLGFVYTYGLNTNESDSIMLMLIGNPENMSGYTFSLFRGNDDPICSNVNLASNTQYSPQFSEEVGMDVSVLTVNSAQTYTAGERLHGYIEKDGIRTNIAVDLMQ